MRRRRRQLDQVTVMQAAFVAALARWCSQHADDDMIVVPAGDLATRAELAKVIFALLQTKRDRALAARSHCTQG
jgi:hypothetical protein